MLRIHPLIPVKTGYLIQDNGKALNHDHLLFTFTHDLIAPCFLSTTPRSRFTSTCESCESCLLRHPLLSLSLLRTLIGKDTGWSRVKMLREKIWVSLYVTNTSTPTIFSDMPCVLLPKSIDTIYFQRITCSLLFAFEDEDETWHVCLTQLKCIKRPKERNLLSREDKYYMSITIHRQDMANQSCLCLLHSILSMFL